MNISISLSPELVGLVKAKVESGRYASTCEGIESGDAGLIDFAQLSRDARREQPASGR